MKTGFVFERLTDEIIDQLSSNRVIVTYKDFNLKRGQRYVKDRLYPEVGGVYDSNMFGSLYNETCNCGAINTVGTLCRKCGSRVLPEEERMRRYARIDLDFYYMMGIKTQAMMNFLLELPLNINEAAEFLEFSRISKSSTPKILELCQFNWDEESKQIFVTPNITDESYASYEGLLKVLTEHLPNYVSDYKGLINKKILVSPAVQRPASYDPFDPTSKLSIPTISSIYQCSVYIKLYIREQLTKYTDPSERVVLKAMARAFYRQIAESTSELLVPSKQNILRAVYSDRVDNSGRAPIVNDPTLEIDQVKIPISLAYEILKVDFISYLADKLSISSTAAELKYKKASKATLDLFREYAPTRRVFVNRPPTLHRYNVMSFKLLVTDDVAIHFPITSVEPMAADFDGDAMSFFLIPESFNELADKNASPATQKKYESTGDFIWQPNQEMLYGLTLATYVDPNKELTNKNNYMSIEDLDKDYEDQVIEYITDKVIYKGNITTYSRVKLGTVIGIDIDDLYKGDYISASNISILLKYLYDLPDFTTKYRDCVQFGLEVVTMEGATVPSMVDILSVDYSKFSEEINALIAKAKEDPAYLEELESTYKAYIKKGMENLPEDIAKRFKWSGRIKLQQIQDMMYPQLIIDDHGNHYLTQNSLVQGFTEEDTRYHAVDNRSKLQMKQALTPNAGYTNRQLILPGQGIGFKAKETDPDNTGVWIPRNRAEGRTDLKGNKLDKSSSTDLILVRSFVSSKLNYITEDMISQVDVKYEDGSNIGLKLTSAVTGTFTQKALSIKHQAILKELDKDKHIIAKEDCTVTRTNSDMIKIVTKGGKEYNHYVPTEFCINPHGKVKKGESIGFIPDLVGPGKSTSEFIDLLGALSTDDIGRSREMNYHRCISPVEGKIHYTNEYVHIGNFKIPRESDAVYYYLEGETVPKFAFICNGVLDCEYYSSLDLDLRDYYGCFRANFLKLLPKCNEHTVEYIFTVCHTRSIEGDKIKYKFTGVKAKVRADKSIMTNLSFEGQKSQVETLLEQATVIDEERSETDLFNKFFLDLLQDNLN